LGPVTIRSKVEGFLFDKKKLSRYTPNILSLEITDEMDPFSFDATLDRVCFLQS